MNPNLLKITQDIHNRSQATQQQYLKKIHNMEKQGVQRHALSCTAQAHAYAAAPTNDKLTLVAEKTPNLGIITAYNDMLSAHQPYATYPDLIKQIARKYGATAQVAGGVPAMCDGITQGADGMELSLFSRDVIALSATIGLSHGTFDAAIYLGICDKIVPGLIMAASAFAHLPAAFLPSGPMSSSITNDEKALARKKFARNEISHQQLLETEMQAYHSSGTCTFYGTANSNQMLLEVMGLQLPGSSFVNPHSELRQALNQYAIKQIIQGVQGSQCYQKSTKQSIATSDTDGCPPAYKVLQVENFINALVVLNATGGSTNLVLHIIAMAKACGIIITPADIAEISNITPLLARIYPNGKADVNCFHACGGVPFIINQLLQHGLLHNDTLHILGQGMQHYCQEPRLDKQGELIWQPVPDQTPDSDIVQTIKKPFSLNGGIKFLTGNLGEAIIKISAVEPQHLTVEAPAKVFENQQQVQQAYQAGELEMDCIIVVRYQGPKAKGMPELHSLTPLMSNLQEQGYQVALITDGRMSGASGKVPAAIHLTPEAIDGGIIGKICDGDILQLNAIDGTLNIVQTDIQQLEQRPVEHPTHQTTQGSGRELFSLFRHQVSPATEGASCLLHDLTP